MAIKLNPTVADLDSVISVTRKLELAAYAYRLTNDVNRYDELNTAFVAAVTALEALEIPVEGGE